MHIRAAIAAARPPVHGRQDQDRSSARGGYAVLMCWLIVMAVLGGPAAAQDVANGEHVFRKCVACHALADGVNRIGPNLHGIVGRPVAAAERYAYSAALREVGIDGGVWDEERLAAYLENPRVAVPGTKMVFAGLKSPDDVADIIAFLKDQE